MTFGRSHGLFRDGGGRVRECSEDPTGVKPPRALLSEDAIPVDDARNKLARRCVASIRAPERSSDSESALRKIESISHGPADAVVGNEPYVRLVDAALVDEVLKEPADGVVCKRRNNGGIEPEAAFEPAGDVVLATSFPGSKRSRGGDTALSWIESEHHFSEGYEIELAPSLGFD